MAKPQPHSSNSSDRGYRDGEMDALNYTPRPQKPWSNVLPMLLGIASLIVPIVSYIILTSGEDPLGPNPVTFTLLIISNLSLLAILGFVILRRTFRLWSQLKQGMVGSRLQTRVVTVFTLVTIVPTLIISIFSALFFNYGIQSWFDHRISTALEKSVIVAQAYLEEHKETIRADAIAMAGDLGRDVHLAATNPALFNKIINGQAALRSLTEAMVIRNGREVARTRLSFSFIFERLPESLYERASQGEVVVMGQDDKITALTSLGHSNDTFLIISRLVDANVLDYISQTQGAADEYKKLESRTAEMQITFSVVFVLVSLLLLMGVIWHGMGFASKLVVPISRLIKAAEHVRAGDYSFRLDETPQDDEMALLVDRFNRMTEQLEQQRKDLTLSNRTLDERRRFTEVVLSGVSAGVIAVDPHMQVMLYNHPAEELLRLDLQRDYYLSPVTALIPELESLLDEINQNPERPVLRDITHTVDERTLTLHTRITTQKKGDNTEGYIITFDDISLLMSAQRRAAWSDVARRIAHEIKNPLTPIQLSVERLKKKFTPDGEKEQASFNRYISTISRHSEDIRTMVDEFASFARMPTPVFRPENIAEILQNSVFSAQTAFADIDISLNTARDAQELLCDEGQLRQVFTNLLKNSAEAVHRRLGTDAESDEMIAQRRATGEQTTTLKDNGMQGAIRVDAYDCRAGYVIDIRDNGVGFPPDKMDSIMEPYVTTRAKGTGLGLAIVKKTVEEHHGTITLANLPEGGAHITITLPVNIDIAIKNASD